MSVDRPTGQRLGPSSETVVAQLPDGNGGAPTYATFAPQRSLRGQLPVPLTSFIGRERAIEEVVRLLGTGRLITLIGAGGIGKTRLAQEIAGEMVGELPDSVWHVDLASLADPTLVSQAVAAALGIREQHGRSMVATLADILAPRRLLLVLDNCEHLATACALLCAELLRASPGLVILATSRQALGVAGETTWYVPSMELDPSPLVQLRTSDQGEYLLPEAVQLFVERATTARPTFKLTPETAPLVGDMCRRLDGIPLAIELAAARIKVLSLEQIAARLDDRFRLLTGGNPDALPRHQTLRALIDSSYELLSEREQILFQRLAVFAGGCTVEAVEAVCAGDGISDHEVLDLLASLVDRSLVVPEETSGEMRYTLLETIRAYGNERLQASGEEQGVRDRHLAWYRDLAVRSEVEFVGPDEPAWLALQRREEANFRAAMEWSKGEADSAPEASRLEAGLILAGALWRFWDMRGQLREGGERVRELLARAAPLPDTLGRAKALLAAGYVAFYQHGDVDQAQSYWEETLRIARAIERGHTMAMSLWGLGMVHAIRGEPDTAELYIEELGLVSREIGSALGIAAAYFWGGELAMMRGDDARAIATFEETLAFARGWGGRWYTASIMLRLGEIALLHGDSARAREMFLEIVDVMSAFEDAHWMRTGLLGLAWVASAQGDAVRAARLMGGVEALNEAVGLPIVVPHSRASHDRAVELARNKLGDDAFVAAWADGRALPFATFMAEALNGATPHASPAAQIDASRASSTTLLSPREREVATLIARGRTNGQIAEALVISRLTAGTHVRNILRKLGFTSRAQIARADRLRYGCRACLHS